MKRQELQPSKRPTIYMIVLFQLLLFCGVNSAVAKDGLIWGANGHPFSAYPNISYEQQLDYMRDLGLRSYRVNISRYTDMPAFVKLLKIAKKKDVVLLPVLTPILDLKKEKASTLYKKARAFSIKWTTRFGGDIRVWELGNELENFAILQPCEIQENGVQYNCKWGPASGVTALEYHPARWKKVSAVLKGLSDGLVSVDPSLKIAMGTAGWGHVGAFERMKQDKIRWDISVWHYYGNDLEWGLKRVAAFGKPIWITEFNHPFGSQKGAIKQGRGLLKIMDHIAAVQKKYNVQAAHIYELLDETYWAPHYEAYLGLVNLEKNKKGKWQTTSNKPAYCVVKERVRGGYKMNGPAGSARQAGTPLLQNIPVPKRQCNLCLYAPRKSANTDKVSYSYCLVLGRKAVGAGVAEWEKGLNAGRPITDVLMGLIHSEEFQKSYQSARLKNSAYVIFMYRLLVNRDPDMHGYQSFVKALDEGKISRSHFLKSIILSNEFRLEHSFLF